MFKFILFTITLSFSAFSSTNYYDQVLTDVIQEFNNKEPNIIELQTKHLSLNLLSLSKAQKETNSPRDIQMMNFIKKTASSHLQKLPCELFYSTTFYHFNQKHDFYYVKDPSKNGDFLIIPIPSKNLF